LDTGTVGALGGAAIGSRGADLGGDINTISGFGLASSCSEARIGGSSRTGLSNKGGREFLGGRDTRGNLTEILRIFDTIDDGSLALSIGV